jgi:tetratricopeptide (TPR) repeat protein
VKRLRPSWLVVGAAIAVAVAAVDSAGWQIRRTIANTLTVNPEAAAIRLGTGPLVVLPSLIVRARQLVTGDLAGATEESLLRALARVGRLQRRWLPADATGFVNLAREEFLRERAQESVDALEKALVRNPTSAYLHRFNALFLFSVGERSSALSELSVAEAIAPGMRRPEVELAAEDQRQVRLEGLRLRADYYPRRKTETSLALARELRIDGDDVGARSMLEDLRGRPEVEIEIARWAIEAGDYFEALELLLPIANRPANPRALRSRSWSMVAVAQDLDGNGEEALSAARHAVELDPDSAAPYVALAGLAQGRGDLEGALNHLRSARGMNPADIRLLTRIASVAEQAGKHEEALLTLERAVEIEPGAPELAARLVELQLRTGRYTEAAMALSESLDRHPTDPGLLNLADRLRREVGIR